MKYKCVHCDKQAVPAWNESKKFFDVSVRVCEECYMTKDYWDHPYKYKDVFEKKGIAFANKHPEYPEGYIATDVHRSPLLLKAEDWHPSEDKSSLILHGETGTCKSRAAWRLFNRLWRKHYPDKSFFLQMRKFEGLIEKGFEDRKHGNVLDILISCPILVLDDLGKERLTQRMESDLFAVIDERTSNLKTTIITTNYTGDKLLERFQNKETGVALVRRLRDYFSAISA
jgi:hypothetical protein